MKTPEEIKRGLVCCGMTPARQQPCKVCPYREPCIETGNLDTSVVIYDAYAYINQLEEQIQLMKIQMHGDCGCCKHRTGFNLNGCTMSQTCYECMAKETRPNWEYEGLPEV